MRSLCIKVPKKDAEKIKRYLEKIGILADLKMRKSGEYVLIPVKDKVEGFQLCEENFEERRRSSRIGSFDVVGDIAIIKYKEGVDFHALAEKIVREHKNIKKVAVDHGVVGEERVRKLKLIIGDSFETIHREYGIRLKVDISKVYFSPRLATERWRVTSQVRDGETIFDMFAGCGPFSILIAKYKRVNIFACDINPHAIHYLKENIKMNKVEGITAILGDAREVAGKIKADRIIMNLPHSSFQFLPYALKSANRGAYIHYYEILSRDNHREEDLKSKAREMGYEIRILEKRRVHPYSPSKDMFSFLIYVI